VFLTETEIVAMDCTDVVRQLWDYLDGELTDESMDAIRGHLAECRQCYPQFDFERTLEDKNAVVSLRQIIRELEAALAPVKGQVQPLSNADDVMAAFVHAVSGGLTE